MMSMLLYHYKQLRKYISEFDLIETRVNNKHRRILTVKNNESTEEPEKSEVRSKAANLARYNNTDIVVILSDKKRH